MKITYYGTAAGECWPGIFCNCPICQKARQLGGKNIRTRSETLINDDLLIDLSADNYLHTLYYGLDLSKVDALIFTHSHSDHCYTEDLHMLRDPFSRTRRGTMYVGGNEAVAKKLLESCGSLGNEEERYLYHNLKENVPVKILDYTVLPLLATHDKKERCLFYSVAQGDKTILYCHDTGALTEDNLAALKRQGRKFNLVSLDCTMQSRRDGKNHMGLLDDAEQKEVLLTEGLADEDTVWVVNHFSHNGGWLHEELCQRAAQYGFIASYDGMTIDI